MLKLHCMMNSKKIKWPVFLFALIMLTGISCNRRIEESEANSQMVISDEAYAEIQEFKPIFYDLYSPVKAYRLFQELNVGFDNSVLNPAENMSKYNASSKIAVNLGIYGADMSFCHLFGQTQESINYLSVISRLAHSIGFSDRFISTAEKAHENIVYHPDSIFHIASSIYVSANKHLPELERSGAASLILAGGWIEALYILEEQILSQKFSLDRLIALLSNQQNDEVASKYLDFTRQLRLLYDRVEISYDHDYQAIDLTRKTTKEKYPKFSYAEEDVSEIVKMVNLIRKDMVN